MLLMKIFKITWKLAPEIINEVFDIIDELRFKSRSIRTVRYGIETTAFPDSRVWSYMPIELKACTSLSKFRSKINTWEPKNCPCKRCKI